MSWAEGPSPTLAVLLMVGHEVKVSYQGPEVLMQMELEDASFPLHQWPANPSWKICKSPAGAWSIACC